MSQFRGKRIPMNNPAGYPKEEITGVILAGGRASRMGGEDKGLLRFAGKTLVEHIAALLAPQVAGIVINANRNAPDYARLGHAVVPDSVGDFLGGGFLGPLAGMASAMGLAKTPYIVTVPCDSPFLPADLVERLYTAMTTAGAEIGVAHDGVRLQPVFALLPSKLWRSAVDFLEGGDRKVLLWYARHKMAPADFSHRPALFLNINTPEDAIGLEERFTGSRPGGREF